MTESVEWERLADHEEGEPAAASAVAPMSDERLAEIRTAHAAYLRRAQRLGLDHAVGGIGELLAEVDRLREQLQSATVLPERWREVLAERDAARRELAEVRERTAGAIVNMPEPEAPDSYAVPAWYDGYERAVEDAARTAREWKAADDG